MTQNNLSVRRRALSSLALGGVLVGSLLVACSKEQKDPDISNVNVGNNNGGTSSGGSSNGGTTANGGSGTGGAAGTAAGGACTVPHQVPDRMTHVCACPGSLPDECPTTGCVSLMTDPANCGTCGNACAAGADCNAGTCTTAPTAVVTLTGCTALDRTAAVRMSPRMILANGVFYITDPGKGTVSSVPVAGGTVTAIATGEMEPDSIAVDATSVYWANRTDNTIRKAPLAGGAATTLLALDAPSADPNNLKPPTMISVSGNLLFFTHINDVFTIPTTGVVAGAGDAGAGSAPTPIDVMHCPSNYDPNVGLPDPGPAVPGATYITGSNESCFKNGYPRAIATSGTNLIYTIKLREGVEANKLDGSGFLKLGASQSSLAHDFVGISDTAGYWASGQNLMRAQLTAQMLGAMGAVPNEIVVATLDFDNITGMTLTATHAYIAAEHGRIARGVLATPGAVGEAVARDQMGAAWLANDGTNLYWLNGDCSINSVPLPP